MRSARLCVVLGSAVAIGALVLLLVMLADWMNRQQQNVIEYLKEENKILREKLGTKRILLRVQLL